jgi:hypothetical protein
MIGLFKKLVANGEWSGTLGADVVTGIVGAANAQTGATPLTASINVISTAVAGASDSFILPQPSAPGETMVVCNDDDGTIDVYPHVGGYVNALSQNASFTMTTGKRALFVAISTSKWAAFTS